MVTVGTLYNGDTLSVGSYAFTDPNAAAINTKTVTVAGVAVSHSGNYTLTDVSNTTSTINPEALTVSTSNVTKPYDGGTTAVGTPVVTVGTLYNSDTLSAGSYAFTDPNAAASGSKTVTVAGVAVSHLGNYILTDASNTTSTINPEALTVSISNVAKTYDGTTTALGAPVVTVGTLYNSDTLSAGSYAFTDPNAAASGTKTVTVAGVAVTNSGNYILTDVSNTASTINPAALTVTATAATKTYGQNSTLTLFTTTPLQNNETVTSVTEISAGMAANASVASYSIVPSAATGGTFNPANYAITYAATGLLTVTSLAQIQVPLGTPVVALIETPHIIPTIVMPVTPANPLALTAPESLSEVMAEPANLLTLAPPPVLVVPAPAVAPEPQPIIFVSPDLPPKQDRD